jgi:predicted Zn-dependent protease
MLNKVKNILIILLICLFSSGLACYADKQDKITKKYGFTLEEELEVGFQATLVMVNKYGIYKNPVVNQYVTDIGESIAQKVSQRPDIKYRFIVLNTPEINAFAAPGGFILITKGTLLVLDNEAELAGILAHEITHVEEGHGMQTLAADPNVKDKLQIIRSSLDAGEGLSQRNINFLDESLKKNRGTSNTVNFDSAVESENYSDKKMY